MAYITNVNENNLPFGQPVIITGIVNMCRVINYWPAKPAENKPNPSQQLQLVNPVFTPVCLEDNPQSPDYNMAMIQAQQTADVIKIKKMGMDKQTGQPVYNWNNTLYTSNDGSLPKLIPLFHRQPDGTVKQIDWDGDLAQGTKVSIMVIPKIRGTSQKNIAQLGQYICIEQANVNWYQGYASESIAKTLGIDPTSIKSQNIPMHEQPNYNNNQPVGYGNTTQPNYGNSQQVGYGNNQPTYGNNQQIGYGANAQPNYGNGQQVGYGNTTQPNYGTNQPAYGNTQQSYNANQQTYGNGQQVGYGNNTQQPYGNNQQAYGANAQPTQPNVPLFNNNQTQPNQQVGYGNTTQPNYGTNQQPIGPSEGFMNVPTGTELPFN